MVMKKENTKNRIPSLQVLRAIAFLGIFLSHAGSVVSWSKLGVSIFFMLSGYLLYQKNLAQNACNITECFQFSYQRIKKIYPLHIITMLAVLLLQVGINVLLHFRGWRWVFQLLIEVLLNVFLIQNWIPVLNVCVSLNGVAWFLSAMVFLYLMFPFLARFVRLMDTNRKILGCILGIWTIQFMIAFLLLLFNVRGIDGHFFNWATKHCPLFRTGDFLIGMLAGKWVMTFEKKETSSKVYTSIEIMVLAISVVVVVIGKIPRTGMITKWLLNPTSIYEIAAVLLLVTFALSAGYVVPFFSKMIPLVWIGNISAELFLIHYVVILYMKAYFNYSTDSLLAYSLIVLELGASILLVLLWKNRKILIRILSRKENQK